MYKYARTTVGADNIRPYNDKLYFNTESDIHLPSGYWHSVQKNHNNNPGYFLHTFVSKHCRLDFSIGSNAHTCTGVTQRVRHLLRYIDCLSKRDILLCHSCKCFFFEAVHFHSLTL